MRAIRTRINYHMIVAIILGTAMPILARFESWSQYAKSNEEYFLDATLLFIGLVFYDASRYFKDFNRSIIFNIRLSDWCIATAYLFWGIMLTDVVVPELETLHFIFTGLAALFVATIMVKYYPTGTAMYHGSILGAALAAGLFLVGLLTPYYSTGWGEWLFAIIAALFMIVAVNKKHYNSN